MHAVIHAADIQDRDGGVLVMASLFGRYPFLLKLYADGGYQGPQFQAGLCRVMKQVSVEIVKRSDTAKAFVVLPKRWIVERTIAWLNRCRRLAKDWECLNRNALAFLRWASIRLMLRKLCRKTKCGPLKHSSDEIVIALKPAPSAIIAAAKQQKHDDDEQKCRGIHSDLLSLSEQAGRTIGIAYKASAQRLGCLFQPASAIPIAWM